MTKKKSSELPPMPQASSDSGKYARLLLDKKPHCRPCAKKKLGISDSLAQGAGVKPLRERYGWDLPSAYMDHCKKCKKKTWHDKWTGEIFENSKGDVNLSKKLKQRILETLGPKDAFGHPITENVCYEHKSPNQRWKTGEQPHDDDMDENQIRATFQLYPDESWNILKDRKGCRICIKSKGRQGRVPVFEVGWPEEVPERGEGSVEGCRGCFWYDTSEYLTRHSLGMDSFMKRIYFESSQILRNLETAERFFSAREHAERRVFRYLVAASLITGFFMVYFPYPPLGVLIVSYWTTYFFSTNS